MSVLHARAPGKVNLCLFVGPLRPDGRHELVSVVQPLELADELALEPAPAGGDEVVCPGVEGENLAARALRAYRDAAGIDGNGWRLTIKKRVPVAAGMGGGSSDAAAALRLAARAAGRPDDPLVERLAPGLGSDVPALLHDLATLVTGAGEEVRPLAGPVLATGGSAHPAATGTPGYVLVPLARRLSTPEVFAEADRLGLSRSAEGLAACRAAVEDALAAGGLTPDLLRNDLQDAARSLCPAIDEALARMQEAGGRALVSGSGPTVFGVFADREAARSAAGKLSGAIPTEALE